MHPKPSRLLALAAGSALLVIASPRPAHAADTCGPGDLYADVQPAFSATGFDLLQQVTLTPQRTLRANNPFWTPTSADAFVFPSDQRVSLSFVYESSAASHALGYMYMDQLQAMGIVGLQGNLLDQNGNGIADLHEYIYNLAPATGSQALPYMGLAPRCNNTFTSGGFTYRQPDLALNANCTSAFTPGQLLEDARPSPNSGFIPIDVVGSSPPSTTSTGYSDNGLYPRIPNLLEPSHPANNYRGIGHLAFLLADDDSDKSTWRGIGAVTDATTTNDGIPDYDVSAYDAHGLPRATNPDPGISAYDRTVDLGVIRGGREVVFFLVVAYQVPHDLDNGTVYPCLRKASNGQCTLHLKTPLSVFFSKASWNLDQDFLGQNPVASRNIGCDADYACNPSNPASSPYACTVAGTSQKLCGWLDYETRLRLQTVAYGSTSLPMTATTVASPGSLGPTMPHAVVGSLGPTSDRWVLAFEDLNGGGDRDFNDVVFMVRNTPDTPSRVQSTVLSPAAEGCAIQQVYMHKDDTLEPTCSAPAGVTYAVSTDCNVCGSGTCVPNPSPTWHPVTFNASRDAFIDVSATPGHQLCWKADLVPGTTGPCQPTIHNVDIGFESGPRNP